MNTFFDLKKQANAEDEILDLVDQDDRVIGQVLRKVANSNPALIHREAAILIFDRNNRVLLEQRSKYKKVNPLMWSVVAGHVLARQNSEEAAHQELLEEAGFDTKLIFADKILHSYSWETHFTYLYLAFYEGKEIVFPKAEVAQMKFVNQTQLSDMQKTEKVNQNVLKICENFWFGKYDEFKKQLEI